MILESRIKRVRMEAQQASPVHPWSMDSLYFGWHPKQQTLCFPLRDTLCRRPRLFLGLANSLSSSTGWFANSAQKTWPKLGTPDPARLTTSPEASVWISGKPQLLEWLLNISAVRCLHPLREIPLVAKTVFLPADYGLGQQWEYQE